MTDVPTTERHVTKRDKLKAWERTGGKCVICGLPVDPTKRWVCEHIRALELGGTNDPENLGPAHEWCAVEKTKGDHRMAGKAKRQKQKHLGIKKRRSITRWRRFSGEIVIADRER